MIVPEHDPIVGCIEDVCAGVNMGTVAKAVALNTSPVDKAQSTTDADEKGDLAARAPPTLVANLNDEAEGWRRRWRRGTSIRQGRRRP